MSPLVTRRDFLRASSQVGLGVALGGGLALAGPAPPGARVVLVRDSQVMDSQGRIRPKVLGSMLDEGVRVLLGLGNPKEAWAQLISSQDIVGIKSNVWHYLPTPHELEEAIVTRLKDLGVAPERISVDDRGVRSNPVFQKATALVNVRPLRTHFWAGIGGCIKNYIMFVPNPSAYHPDGCADLGAVWKEPLVKGKTRLNILCAITPQFYGRGPHFFDRRYTWPYCGLILSLDPVAADSVGARLLALKRTEYFGEDRPLDVTPHHIEVADRIHGLGVGDLSRIQLLKVGWAEGALV